ncbi:MAG: histidine kinase, partial [Bacteroidia bacterium]|nr:histidine kinase [Bacteroidia bacterium]
EYFLISILILAGSTSYKLFLRWINEERKNEALENERLKSELALLRLQVSPHFLMNTLNNIYALTTVDQERAGDAVIRLSTLMRYLLYDTRAGKTTLPKELEFIESYFMLMKLRYPQNVELIFEQPSSIPDIAIPAMLFISFLENAFKHGISYENKSFVHFKMSTKNARLNCFIQNSVHPGRMRSNDHYSGIGLTNVQQSLNLLYPNEYILDIQKEESAFTVTLSIPI